MFEEEDPRWPSGAPTEHPYAHEWRPSGGFAALRAIAITGGWRERPLFRNVGFTLHRGEVLCVVGENGSGKTTLLRVLAGHHPLVSGSVEVCAPGGAAAGFPASFSAPFSGPRPIQDHQLPLTVWGFVHDAVVTADPRLPAAEAAIVRFGLGPDQIVATLSDGELQRLQLVLAFLSQASVYLLDSPTARLDSDGRDLAEGLVTSLAERHAGVIVATNDPDLVLRLGLCSIYSLADGQLRLVRPALVAV